MSIAIRFKLHRKDFNMAVDLTLPDTGVSAIFGPSGSGKTTLLRTIAGLESLPDCHISFRNQVWQDNTTFMPVHERGVGYVFQEPSLFPHLSIQQNLEYGFKRLPDIQKRVSLNDAINLLNIESLLDRDPLSLSGGEQQRVAIARTLAASPQLLLMDEPLSSLDNKLKLEILPYLETLHKELAIPVLYVSHATDEVARLADTLVVLRKGEVLGTGPIQDMLTRLDLPLSHRSDAEALLTATVKNTDQAYTLTHLDAGGFQFSVPGIDLQQGSIVRIRIAAHDVSLTLEKQSGTSIQNIFPATVLEMIDESEAQSLIKLSLGNNPVLARITKKSVQELDIAPGKEVFAQIKSVAVLS